MDHRTALAARDGLRALAAGVDPQAVETLEALEAQDDLEALEGLKARDVYEERIDAHNDLLSDLRCLVNKAEWSDVVLQCSDGVDVHGCRGLLAIRCSVFERMLSNGMLDTRSSEISFPNISFRAMLCVLEFLYTGSIHLYSQTIVDWTVGLEAISAAQYLAVRTLEVTARDSLRRQLLKTDSLSQKTILMEMLSEASEFPEIWDEKDKLLVSLVDHIGGDWFEEHSAHKLSARALDYILSFRKRGCVRGEELSMDEYFTFRNIVLWLVCQAVPKSNAEARAAVQKVLPGKDSVSNLRRVSDSASPADINHYIADESNSMTSCDTTAVLNSIIKSKICKKSLEHWLRHINFDLIPPSLLLNVIYPLEIIPPRQLLESFIRQAFRSTVRIQYSLPEIYWKHGGDLKVGVEGQISSTANNTSGRSAVALIEKPTCGNTYEWSFKILDDMADFIVLGCICHLGDTFEEKDLMATNLWYRSSSRILCINRRNRKTYVSKENPKRLWEAWECFETEVKLNSSVNFKLNRSTKTCQVTFGGSYGAVWKDFPDGEFYPAVGFSASCSARVQLRLGDGFYIIS